MIASIALISGLLGVELARANTNGWIVAALVIVLTIDVFGLSGQIEKLRTKNGGGRRG